MASKQRARAAATARKSSAKQRGKRSRQKQTLADVAPTTKLAAVVAMLSTPKGATLAQLMTLTGWQQHSIRGVMSGTIKKKLGYAISSKKVGAERVYHIRAGR